MAVLDTKILRQRILFRRIIQVLIIIGIFLMTQTSMNHENDIFWQLRMGEEIVKNHHFPIRDTYNLPAYGDVWTLEEWLPASLFYIIYSHFGPVVLIVFKGIVVASTFTLFLMLFNRMKVNLYLSLLILILAALVNTRGVWVVFPSIFEYLFIVTTLVLLEGYRRSRKIYIPVFLILLSFIWAQSHASFFLLTGIVGAYLLGDMLVEMIKSKREWYTPIGDRFSKKERISLGIVMIFSLIAPFATPNGYWTFLYPFRISLSSFSTYVSEYQKFWNVWDWNFANFVNGFTFILIVMVATVFLLARKRLHISDLILGLFFTGLALVAVRHVAIFALVALFLICRYLTLWFGEYRGIFKRSLLKDTVVMLLIIASVIYYKTHLVGFGYELSEQGYPKQAAELITSNNLLGNMFNHYNYGGYLIWKMPQYKVFIDGRLEMYLGQAGKDYLTILFTQPGFKKLLTKYHINFFLVYLTDQVVEYLMSDPAWKFIYGDNQYVVFVKNDPKNQVFLEKYYSPDKEKLFFSLYKEAIGKQRAEQFNIKGLQSAAKGDFLAAADAFQRALVYDPDFQDARMNLARAYIEARLYTAAEREYQKIIAVDPHNEQARKNLTRLSQLHTR